MLDIRSRDGERERGRKRGRDRHDKKRRRLLHEYNNRTIPFERRAAPSSSARPPPFNEEYCQCRLRLPRICIPCASLLISEVIESERDPSFDGTVHHRFIDPRVARGFVSWRFINEKELY